MEGRQGATLRVPSKRNLSSRPTPPPPPPLPPLDHKATFMGAKRSGAWSARVQARARLLRPLACRRCLSLFSGAMWTLIQ